MKIPQEFLCSMCNLFKIKTKSCVMPLLHHAAAGYILFLSDDAQCVEGGGGRECYGSILGFTTSHLCCCLRLLSQVTEKLLEVENETMMKVADLEKLLLQKDKDLQVIRVSWLPVMMQYSSACIASERLPFTSLCAGGDHFQMHVSKLL